MPHSAAMLHSVLQQSGRARPCACTTSTGPTCPRGAREPLAEMVERARRRDLVRRGPRRAGARGCRREGFTRKATWYRIFLPDLLPEVDRILFLDADLLALDSLAPLWETDLSEHYLAAVTNVFQADHLFRPAQLGLRPARRPTSTPG